MGEITTEIEYGRAGWIGGVADAVHMRIAVLG